VKQAIDYAANKGVDWVLLTTGMRWCVYHVRFAKPIQHELLVDIDFSKINPRSQDDLDLLYLWCKEGWQRSALGEFHTQKQALSRFVLGAIVLTDTTVDVVRRELRRVNPDIRITADQIRTVLLNEVLKRDVVEGEQADAAKKIVSRAANKALRASAIKEVEGPAPSLTEALPPI
jgi:predicted type IV restriction endonuclease